MREIKRTDNGLIDNLLRQLEHKGSTPTHAVQIGPVLLGKNIVGDNASDYPNIMSNDITLSDIFGRK